jgi:addiction module HigA family antidote
MERKLKRTHPGYILRMELIDGQNLSVSKVAELLNTTRANLSNILNGHAAISPNMALRIVQRLIS